jgi:hypothetical protein
MATAPVIDLSPTLPALQMLARVGKATWAISLDAEALGRIIGFDNIADLPQGLDLRWVMESLHQKARSLRMFGGGAIALSAADISAPPSNLCDDKGNEIAFQPWYEIVSIIANEA